MDFDAPKEVTYENTYITSPSGWVPRAGHPCPPPPPGAPPAAPGGHLEMPGDEMPALATAGAGPRGAHGLTAEKKTG